MEASLEEAYTLQGIYSEGSYKHSSNYVISVAFSFFHILTKKLTSSLTSVSVSVVLIMFITSFWLSG